MSVEPCPKCGCKDVRIRTEHVGGMIVVFCPRCDMRHTLKTAFPCIPEDIIEEWNAYCRVQRRLEGESE